MCEGQTIANLGVQSCTPKSAHLPTLLESLGADSVHVASKPAKPKIEIVINELGESERMYSPAAFESRARESTYRDQSGFRIRNTFIEVGSPSVDSMKARAINSCPGKRVGLLHRTMAAFSKGDIMFNGALSADVDSAAQEPEHCSPTSLTRSSKPVLLLADALGGDTDPIPPTPEPFSIGRCYGRTLYEDLSSEGPDMASLASSNQPLATSGAHQYFNPGNDVSRICPATFRSGDAYNHYRMNGKLNNMTANLAVCSLDSHDSHRLGEAHVNRGSEESHHILPVVGAHAQPFHSCSGPQHASVANVPRAPPAPPAFHAPASMDGFATMPPPAPIQPAPGSEELPSVGSAGHAWGECKPCAFLHTKGCENGALCQFCHICEPGEKRRRQKERKQARRGGA